MGWKLRLVRKTLGNWLPLANQVRKMKRIVFGYPLADYELEGAIADYDRMKSAILKLGMRVENSVVLEIGSGWFPVIPILFARDGAKKVLMTDLNVHMDDITFKSTANALKKHFPNDEFIRGLSTFSSLPIDYLAPFNVSSLTDKQVDLVVSHEVLEHIPRCDLYSLFASLRPKISDTGAMVHMVDHSDHFEHYDKSISRINFLTWGDEKHSVINFLIRDGENRMRHQEYHQLFSDAGYKVINEETETDESTLKQIGSLPLTYPYNKMSPKDIAVVTSIYSVRKS